MQENRGRERVGENAFDPSLRQAFFGRTERCAARQSAIHFPRRRISETAKPCRRRARTTAVSWLRKIPERIKQPPGARCRDQIGSAAIRISLKRFAVMMSNFPVSRCFRISPVENSMLRTPLARAFRFAVAQARGSLSMASDAPGAEAAAGDRENAAARAGVEHASNPVRDARVIRSSKRRHIAVVAWSPGAERGFGGNDERSRGGRSSRRCAQNHEPRADAQRFALGLLRKMLKPVGPQFLHAAAKFAEEFAAPRSVVRQETSSRRALASRALDDRKRAAEPSVKLFASVAQPTRSARFRQIYIEIVPV